MRKVRQCILLVLIIPAVLSLSTEAVSQEVVRVDSDQAGIYAKPDPEIDPFMWAQEGDAFQLEKQAFGKKLVGIRMFSGDTRYLRRDDVTLVYIRPDVEGTLSKRLQLCDEVQKIEADAASEAQSTFSEDDSRARSYENRIIDKRILNLFREHDVAAVHYPIFRECINDSIVPTSGP